MFVLIKDTKVNTLMISKELFPEAVEAPDDIVFGDHFIDGEWIRDGERNEAKPQEPDPLEIIAQLEAIIDTMLNGGEPA